MQVTKLTITPIVSGCKKFVIQSPSQESAANYITERLISGIAYEQNNPARVFRKIPKSLKGFINPKSKVVNERKFTTIV